MQIEIFIVKLYLIPVNQLFCFPLGEIQSAPISLHSLWVSVRCVYFEGNAKARVIPLLKVWCKKETKGRSGSPLYWKMDLSLPFSSSQTFSEPLDLSEAADIYPSPVVSFILALLPDSVSIRMLVLFHCFARIQLVVLFPRQCGGKYFCKYFVSEYFPFVKIVPLLLCATISSLPSDTTTFC